MSTTLKATGINNKVRSRAGYYGQEQFSLFTVVIYMKQNDDTVCENYSLVTPENDHSCNRCFGPNNFILSTMQVDYDIKTVKLWSDGCASQFAVCLLHALKI